MQRKRGPKSTRAPNALEKRLASWIKQQPCCICHRPGPSIVDHMYGSCHKHNKVLIGMLALLPYCPECDKVKTHGSHRAHFEAFGKTQAEVWLEQLERLPFMMPPEVVESVKDWGR
jgi:hypothetical protein